MLEKPFVFLAVVQETFCGFTMEREVRKLALLSGSHTVLQELEPW